MNGHGFTAVASLVCDDVRREISGKEILIGVYADNVYVSVIPANLNVNLYIRALFGQRGVSNIKFKILGPGGIQVTPEASISFPAPPDPESVASIIVGGIIFQAQAEGKYEFQWQPPGQEWETVTYLHIRKGNVPPPNVTQPPASIAGQPQSEQSPPAVLASS
jgi:hypothetical protein